MYCVKNPKSPYSLEIPYKAFQPLPTENNFISRAEVYRELLNWNSPDSGWTPYKMAGPKGLLYIWI